MDFETPLSIFSGASKVASSLITELLKSCKTWAFPAHPSSTLMALWISPGLVQLLTVSTSITGLTGIWSMKSFSVWTIHKVTA